MSAAEFKEWANLLFRWVHVFAGIMWVGTTYYFTWLDGRFIELEAALTKGNVEPNGKAEKDIWMVHSGGFYRVEKQKVPQVMPDKLHWFRWEAALTWFSGLLLYMLVYYHGGLMVDLEDARISSGAAIGLSVGLLLVSWAVYDVLWGRVFKNEMVGVVISAILVIATTWLCFHYFARRAACLQFGAMFGTIMTANVWMRILPCQRRMVAALKAGQAPNDAEAKRAKTRSKHNTFMVIPVVFLMISNHYPSTYSWITVSILILLWGWFAAKFVRRA